MELNIQNQTFTKCDHCNDTIKPNDLIVSGGHNFCCNGCKTVYSILHEKGLENFYNLRSEEEFTPSPQNTEKNKRNNFTFMDEDEFKNEFVTNDGKHSSIKFYLEGVHCMACIWLIEKTPSIIKGLTEARLNITDSSAIFKFNSDIKISNLAKELQAIGYYPHPIAKESNSDKFFKEEERSEILKIGIAGAGMGNIMIYAVSNYAGADGGYREAFNIISFFLSIPVVFYSAIPFYKTSLQAIKLKSISIDIPIAMAIIIGFVFSTIGLFTGSEHNYFDSITALVFLILISRYFVKKATRQGLNTKGLNTLFNNTFVTKIENGLKKEVHTKFINRGDTVLVAPFEKIVFDGKMISKIAEIDNSALSGESRPCILKYEEDVYAGSINLGEEFLMIAQKSGDETKLGKILKEISSQDLTKNEIVSKADKIAKYFVWAVSILTVLVFCEQFYFYGLNPALEKALAVVIISCPCALALATPLAYVKSLELLKLLGLYVKNDSVLEKINNVQNIYLDKTGTITEGKFEITDFKNLSSHLTDLEIFKTVYALEKDSIHPIAISLKKYLKNIQKISLEDINDFIANSREIKQIPGLGVSLIHGDENIFIGKIKEEDRSNFEQTQVALYINDKIAAYFTIGDSIKKNSQQFIQKLQGLNKNIHILSGDHQKVVESVANHLNIKSFMGDLSPEDKAHIIEQGSNTLMIGDGINDALAFKKADVSIAVSGSADISLRASEVFMTSSNLEHIYNLFLIAKETKKVLYRNFYFSIFYNVFGVALALMGIITPLWAAIFMPLSSLTVLTSSFIGTKNMRNIDKFTRKEHV